MYKVKQRLIRILSMGILLTSIVACQNDKGTISFTANGEDFVANGFMSKDGWDVNFDRVFINLSKITAYNAQDSKLSAELPGSYLIDLKDSPIVAMDKLTDLPKGNYQSLRFSLTPIENGEYQGSSIVMKGTAVKEGESIDFLIKLNEELTFDGKEGYVGDTIKGLLKEDETEVEMTFHFDHLFGDIEADADDHVNTGSPGFNFFLPFNDKGSLIVDQKQLSTLDGYDILMGAIETLGHLGEGHCEVIR